MGKRVRIVRRKEKRSPHVSGAGCGAFGDAGSSRRLGRRLLARESWREGVMEGKIRTLLDCAEIREVQTRYATGVDRRDPDLYRSCFTDEIELDMSEMGLGEAAKVRADVWVEQALSLVSVFKSTQHMITNHTITIDGDRATCVSYLQAQHYNPEHLYTVGGYYSNELVRTREGWKICKLKLTPLWTQST